MTKTADEVKDHPVNSEPKEEVKEQASINENKKELVNVKEPEKKENQEPEEEYKEDIEPESNDNKEPEKENNEVKEVKKEPMKAPENKEEQQPIKENVGVEEEPVEESEEKAEVVNKKQEEAPKPAKEQKNEEAQNEEVQNEEANYDENFEDEESKPVSKPHEPEKQNEEVEEKKEEKPQKEKKQPHKKVKSEAKDYENINEEQMIEIAQNCFQVIAEKLMEKKLNIHSLFQGKITKEKIDDEVHEVLTGEIFMNGIQELCMDKFQEIDYACLIKVLTVNEEGKFIRVNDLTQILHDYGVIDENEPKKEKSKLNFEKLDQISMVLMLALTEYLVKANVPLNTLFDKVIKKEPKESSPNKMVEYVMVSDFFEVLQKIGIQLGESEDTTLNQFLCFDGGDPNKISVKKLKAAIEEFAFNEELREIAHKCYEEIIGEEDVESDQNAASQRGKKSIPEPKKQKSNQVYF